MTIKSDRWIRKMALEHKMIEPFVETQVRQGVVSYGLSSYGYDLRVADEFKIFTNINSTIVDPKNFDASSFVDVRGDCIVPPNSFALARTVEYLRIPRNVITVCLGKCVTGDTRVVDAATGDYLPISEFAGRTRTVGLDGWRLRELGVSEFIPQGKKPVFRLRTRTGLEIRATASHPFRQLHGWTKLSDLRAGDRIAVARQVPVFGSTPLGEEGAAALARTSYHSVPPAVFRAPRADVAAFVGALFERSGATSTEHEGAAARFERMSRRLAEDVHHLLLRFGVVSRVVVEETSGGATTHAVELAGDDMALRLSQALSGIASAARSLQALEATRAATSGVRRAEAGAGDGDLTGPAVMAARSDSAGVYDLLEEHGPLWDTIEAIEPAGEEEVFDLSVPGAENFLANDFIIHNSTYARCGIIVNVTPFEPEWEGHATLEISNTTPLPARIYANEGLCQVLFFESDEPCETSYADKAGKYQSQGPQIVLPRM